MYVQLHIYYECQLKTQRVYFINVDGANRMMYNYFTFNKAIDKNSLTNVEMCSWKRKENLELKT